MRGLVRFDPAGRKRRRWTGPAMCFAGLLLPGVATALPGVFIFSLGGSPYEIPEFVGPFLLLLFFLTPFVTLARGARAFLFERRTKTMDALRMTPLPRSMIVAARFAAAFRPIFWMLVGLLPGCMLLPLLTIPLSGLEVNTIAIFWIGALVWFTQALLALTACVFGVYASVRHSSFSRAIALAWAFLLMTLIFLGFGGGLTAAGVANLLVQSPRVILITCQIVPGVFFIGTGLVSLPLYSFREAALHFDDWATAAEEAA